MVTSQTWSARLERLWPISSQPRRTPSRAASTVGCPVSALTRPPPGPRRRDGAALAGLEPLHQRHVAVLQGRPPDLEVGDLVAVLGEELAHEPRRVLRGVDEVLAVATPAHLRPALDPAGELGGAAVGDDPAAGQDQDPVGQLLGLVEVVGGQHDRGALQVGEPVHHVVELAPGLRVEAGRGLVQEQHVRAAHDADRDVEAAPLAAGERRDLLAARAR